jgi:hypothetical protein
MEMLLTPETGIRAVKSSASDFQGLIGEVCDSKSQVVILEDAVIAGKENCSLSELLMSNPELKIIVVLRDSNRIHVFRKDEIMIQSSSDFIEAIHSS